MKAGVGPCDAKPGRESLTSGKAAPALGTAGICDDRGGLSESDSWTRIDFRRHMRNSDCLVANKKRNSSGKQKMLTESAAWKRRSESDFREEFVTLKKALLEHADGAYALSLGSKCNLQNMKTGAAARLAGGVRKFRTFNHRVPGHAGAVPRLCATKVILDEATLLNRKEDPSWIIGDQGATNHWERWDGTKPEGSFQESLP